ncbi:MAG: lysylphosphatidylglycerol synthase transmembrane domain-containing protein [Chloroflexota bacterium]
MNRHAVSLLKVAIGLALLVWLYYLLEDPAETWQNIVNANGALLALGALMYTGAVALSGLKWGILLRAIGIPVPIDRLLTYQWIAEFFNNFSPAQVGGDVMRGYSLAIDTQRRADAAASVLIDRFIGLTVFMIAAAVASSLMILWGYPIMGVAEGQDTFSYMRLIALGSLGASLLLIGAIVALLSRRLKEWAEMVMVKLPLIHRLTPIWHQLADAFNAYRHQKQAIFVSAVSSGLIVILTSINIWLISSAISPNSISLMAVLTINPIIVFVGLALPLTPGGLGVRQAAFALSFGLVGVDAELGIKVGLLQQIIGYLVSLPGGLLWMRGRQSISPVMKQNQMAHTNPKV